MYLRIHVKYPLFCQILMELELSQQVLEKYSNIKFHNNLLSESRVFPRRWTDGQTDS